jgi:hypothetical protein
VLGYLTFSFEDKCKNRADDQIVSMIRHLPQRVNRVLSKPLHFLERLRGRQSNKPSRPEETHPGHALEAEDDPARKYRIESIRDFMLALSDQQLVTGVAMLVAAFGRWSEITVYSANVVAALAFFSTSVHIGTLDFLTTYLRRHYVVKGCRVFAMMTTLILLIFILVLQLSIRWWATTGEANLFFICAFWDFSLLDVSFQLLLTQGYVIVLLLLTHYERIRMLYSEWGLLPQGQDGFTQSAMEKYGIKHFDYRMQIYKNRARQLLLRPASLPRSIATLLMVESFAFHEMRESRYWEVCELLYSNIYGAIIIFYMRDQHEGTVGPFNTMGFGQIVPIFLLALLIFAAVESIYGK